MRVPSLIDTLRPAFKDAYTEAVASDANMRKATDCFESLREALASDVDVFSLWRFFDDQLGRSAGTLQQIIKRLHSKYEQTVIEEVVGSLRKKRPDDAIIPALEVVAECFGEGNSRYSLLSAVADAELSFVSLLPPPLADHSRLKNFAACVKTTRWTESYDAFISLGNDERLKKESRACMLLIAAEIQLYHFKNADRAREVLEKAGECASEIYQFSMVWGEWNFETNNLKSAEKHFRKVLNDKPRVSDGYVNLGQLAERAGDLSGAETQYRQAIANAPGEAEGYECLWRLLLKTTEPTARDERWEERRKELFDRILLLHPNESYYLVEIADTARSERRWEEARSTYRRAIDLDPARLDARTGLVYVLSDEVFDSATTTERSADALAEMRRECSNTLSVFPNAADALWVMVVYAETMKEWNEVIRWCDKLVSLQPEWKFSCVYRQAIAYWWMNRLELAEQLFEDAVRLNSKDTNIANDIAGLGDTAKKAGDTAMARRLYLASRNLSGDDAEYQYQNRLGNLEFEQGNYVPAIEHYRRAVSARPENDVLHANLAGALAAVATPGRQEAELSEAAREMQEAIRLEPADQSYPPRLRDIQRKLDLVRRYGEEVLAYDFVGTALRISLDGALLKLLLKPDVRVISDAAQAYLQTVRDRVHQRTGVRLPLFLFDDIPSPAPGHNVQFTVFDSTPIPSTVPMTEGREITAEELIDWLEPRLEQFVDSFVTHDSVASGLKERSTPESAKLLESPQHLTAFVRFLRERRQAGECLANIEGFVEKFAQQKVQEKDTLKEKLWTWDPAPPTKIITICAGSGYSEEERVELETQIQKCRPVLLTQMGIPVPHVVCAVDTTLSPRGFRIEFNTYKSSEHVGLNREEVWVATVDSSPSDSQSRESINSLGQRGLVVRDSIDDAKKKYSSETAMRSIEFASFELGFELGRHAHLLIDLVFVEHRLEAITPTYPMLVRSIRDRFTREELVSYVRERFLNNRSLRDFTYVLEQWLIEDHAQAELNVQS